MAEPSSPRQARFEFPEGTVALTYPTPISAESLSELRELFAIVLRQLERPLVSKERNGEIELASWSEQNPGDAEAQEGE